MDVFEALYTTRAMRRVRPDPVPSDVQASILDAAIRAPTGGNAQNWRFLLVDDAEVIARLAPLYKAGIDSLWVTLYADRVAWAAEDPDDPERQAFLRVQRSAQWAADNFTTYPLLLFGFAQHDPTGGSIYPALWSAQLAARAHGVGSTLTAVLLFADGEVKEILGVPADEGWNQAGCVLMGYPTGRWGVAERQPVQQVSYRNRWGEPLGVEVTDPLWP
ncbi:MAG TPA: nitroreductase family protein [Microthrixaceae bacterium]|nr:nitroreductase family protein [Microthrixaceae bacterium]RTL08038.1 MAG: nitroreductase family protein [Acidimicrobiia bacterium]MCB9375671.1 nitroreductase family protein [Microthrixaceae bacterium]MCB9402271.1 nitroreductase family protein [Microthrixaceae bacterium]MCO5306585.1 nitroreductase family protein [Microthrixaceae bacterium]